VKTERVVVCPRCQRPFIRRAALRDGAIWDGTGGQGWYYPIEQVDWCVDCRAVVAAAPVRHKEALSPLSAAKG
jgi:hypothetical protein